MCGVKRWGYSTSWMLYASFPLGISTLGAFLAFRLRYFELLLVLIWFVYLWLILSINYIYLYIYLYLSLFLYLSVSIDVLLLFISKKSCCKYHYRVKACPKSLENIRDSFNLLTQKVYCVGGWCKQYKGVGEVTLSPTSPFTKRILLVHFFRIRSCWVAWIRILYPQKCPCNSNFLVK